METWGVAGWAAIGFNLVVGGWLLTAAIRYERKIANLGREDDKARPLLSDDKAATLRAGDTVLLMPSLGMTSDQQKKMMVLMKEIIVPLRERGIEFIVLPDWGQKAIVVSRGTPPRAGSDGAFA
ncbi:hypothetical protein Q8G38_00390 [Halomonas venusta]|uniref:hypothetical protein n=1 Tax=Vreelandella venusta TaxID=44935 RepID=UPI00295F2E4E|nr:hypothetical protein [Halomonas venusta]MDW0357767.1 hypothetical protein [Halomonas venusta]